MVTMVVKRSGEKTEYDATKIKKSIELATDTINVNPLELESKISLFMRNGIKTKEIQENVVQHAVQLATSQEPQWLKVAGRAYAMDKWADFKLRGKSFFEIVSHNVKNGVYSKDLLKFYTQDQIKSLGEYIDHNRDLDHSYASLYSGYKKYIKKTELNQHVHMINAMRFGQFEPETSRISFVKDVYDSLSNREISLATPFMSNLRSGGNIASCFILAIEDDLDSIFDNVKNIAKISKNGGGIGVYLGKIRAKGSSVNGYENAAGSITQWVKIINDTAVAVNQGGLRKGAATVALPIWHNDILDFIDMQTEHGDNRLKSYDIFPQIVVPDLFMKRDEENSSWTTFCPFEVKKKLGIEMYGLWGEDFEAAYAKIEDAQQRGILKVSRVIKARDLMKTYMRVIFETGLPYHAFVDEINRQNPNKHDGFIPCTNLCTESYSNVVADDLVHVCNLASVNMGNIKDMKHLVKVSRLITRILDYGIEMTNNPLIETKKHNERYRTIGVGIMGLHDYIAKNFMSYNELDEIGLIAETIEMSCIRESIELAKQFGSFKAFSGSEWETGARIARFKEMSNQPDAWNELQLLIDEFGLRNSQLTSPAPTTSTSLYQDASATYLPIYSAFFSEDNSNGALRVSAKYLDINPISYSKNQSKFSAIEIIDITSEIQKWTDTGISMEIVLDQNRDNFKARDLYDAIRHAWKKKLKAIYYIRTIKKNESLKKEEVACVGCSG